MAGTYSIEWTVQSIKSKRDFTDYFLGELAALYGIPGSSQTRISQGLRGVNPFSPEHEPLRTLVQDLDAYCESVAPIPVSLRRPVLIKQLLDAFLKTRQVLLVRPVYVVEFTDDHSLLEGVQDNVVRRTLNGANAAPIRDRETAAAVVDVLDKMGYRCVAHPTRMRLAESRIADSLKALGFVQ